MRGESRLRPMGITDLLDEAVDIYKTNFVLLIGIAAVLYVPYSLIGDALTLRMFTPEKSNPEAIAGAIVPLMATFLLFMALVVPIVTGALTFAISERYLDRKTSIVESYRRVLKGEVFFPLIGALVLKYGSLFLIYLLLVLVLAVLVAVLAPLGTGGIVIEVVLAVGLVLLLVHSFLRLILVEPALIIEMRGAGGSLGRSWGLMKGSTGKALSLVIITGLAVVMISVIIAGPTQGIIFMKQQQGAPVSPIILALNIVLSTLVNVVTVPVYSIVAILLYYDVRIRREGFDLELLAAELDRKSRAFDAQGIAALPREQLSQAEPPTPPNEEPS